MGPLLFEGGWFFGDQVESFRRLEFLECWSDSMMERRENLGGEVCEDLCLAVVPLRLGVA